MSRQTSAAFKAATFASQTKEAFILLVTISHPTFTEDARFCSDPYELLPTEQVRGVISNGLEYIYMPMQITLPQQDDASIARANIAIDNIDRRIVNAVRRANSAVTVSIQIVLSADPDTVEMSAPDFRLEQVDYDALTVSGNLSLEYFGLEPYPWARFTPSNFPGLF